jgi:hypothetical protein
VPLKLQIVQRLDANGAGNPNDVMGQFEVTTEMQLYVLARLSPLSIIEGEDATPTHTKA